MSFRVAFDPGDPGRPGARLGRSAGADAGFHRRILREGVQVIAHGALICPECAMPIATPGAVRAAARLECGYCEHAARAHEFLAHDVYDTLGNEAQLVARIV